MKLESSLADTFDRYGTEDKTPEMAFFNKPGWSNRQWTGLHFRSAQINSVITENIYMMHSCVYPQYNSSAPIFGFDVFAGKTKITGVFHDFSPTLDHNNPMISWFEQQVVNTQWDKTRTLPDWALAIFSPNIVAVGNLSDGPELNAVIELVNNSVGYYFNNLQLYHNKHINNIVFQKYYCEKQKENPHNAPVLRRLGLSVEQVNQYIDTCLFPTPQNYS